MKKIFLLFLSLLSIQAIAGTKITITYLKGETGLAKNSTLMANCTVQLEDHPEMAITVKLDMSTKKYQAAICQSQDVGQIKEKYYKIKKAGNVFGLGKKIDIPNFRRISDKPYRPYLTEMVNLIKKYSKEIFRKKRSGELVEKGSLLKKLGSELSTTLGTEEIAI